MKDTDYPTDPSERELVLCVQRDFIVSHPFTLLLAAAVYWVSYDANQNHVVIETRRRRDGAKSVSEWPYI